MLTLPTPLQTFATDPVWLQIAAREQGVHETPGPASTARILDYGTAVDLTVTTDELPWCSTFVNWVLREAGYARTRSAAAVSWLRYGRDATSEEFRGAIVVLTRLDAAPDPQTGSPTGNHVTFGVTQAREYVDCLGGNQHDQVKTSRFPRAVYRVRTVRLPRTCDRLVVPAA